MDRKTFLKSLTVLPASAALGRAESGKCETATCTSDAAAVRTFLSGFLKQEEGNLDRATLVKLMEERGRACCRNLDFRQKLIVESAGNLDKLVELMGKIVGPENCRRVENRVTLIYPSGKCGCGWSPKRAPMVSDPYCECSKANNQLLFATVTGKQVKVQVAESPRRKEGGRCTFLIDIAG